MRSCSRFSPPFFFFIDSISSSSSSSSWCFKMRETPKVINLLSNSMPEMRLPQTCYRQFEFGHRMQWRCFTSEAGTKNGKTFTFSDDDDDGGGGGEESDEKSRNLPPPYDPFSKKPVIEEPSDPKNLQEIFHKMRTEGLINNAIKMFDALSKDGLTHEAMELFAQIKDKGSMPDVVAHTAVIEAYANAGGQSKEALKVYMRMLASGVKPNAFTYAVLIKGLARDGKLGDAQKYLLEMMEAGIRPNPATYTSVFEAFARAGDSEQGAQLLDKLRAKGFVADEAAVREHLASKRGQVFRSVMSLLFRK